MLFENPKKTKSLRVLGPDPFRVLNNVTLLTFLFLLTISLVNLSKRSYIQEVKVKKDLKRTSRCSIMVVIIIILLLRMLTYFRKHKYPELWKIIDCWLFITFLQCEMWCRKYKKKWEDDYKRNTWQKWKYKQNGKCKTENAKYLLFRRVERRIM